MDTQIETATPDVARTLGVGGSGRTQKKRWITWAVIAVVAAVLAYWFFGRGSVAPVRYTTAEVTRGSLVVTITATGNLEPRNQVDIGSELSGTVRTVHVDVNDEVKVGQLLAVLDTTRLEAQVLQARSSLASAEARVLQTEASEKEARANYARLLKVRELSDNKLPSQQDLDVAEASVARAVGEVAAARAAVEQARANLEAVRTDLSKTEIRSPINGVVLVRSIEPGSTVAATMTAPVLFTLAEDLKKMELHVSVDEADVGSVEVGQRATFTVDAFANRRFEAHITKVHLASSNTQKSSSSAAQASATSTGVVTYQTVLEVDNSEQLLRPGMTATAEIVTTAIEDAILIPNTALRFTPPDQGAAAAQARPGQGNPFNVLMPMGGPRRMQGPGGANAQAGRRVGRAWVLENGKPAMVAFRPGATDGRNTQVLPLDAPPANLARTPDDPMAQEFLKAMERKLEPGVQVIVDADTPT